MDKIYWDRMEKDFNDVSISNVWVFRRKKTKRSVCAKRRKVESPKRWMNPARRLECVSLTISLMKWKPNWPLCPRASMILTMPFTVLPLAFSWWAAPMNRLLLFFLWKEFFLFLFLFSFFFLSADDYFLLFFSTEVIVVNIMPDFESRYTLDCNDMSKVKKWNYVWIDWMFYAGIRINETMNDFGYMWRVVQVVRDYETRKARIKELSNAINRISDRASLIEQKMYLSTTFADIIWLFWLITEPV